MCASHRARVDLKKSSGSSVKVNFEMTVIVHVMLYINIWVFLLFM